MKLFVPNCKTEFILTKPWKFRLYFERRCDKLLETSGIMARNQGVSGYGWDWRYHPPDPDSGRYRGDLKHEVFTLPKGSILRVSRVYIRQQTSDTYDSLTFWLKKTSLIDQRDPKARKKMKGRFWAKLADVNTMQCEVYLGPDAHQLTPGERKTRIQLLFED